MKENKIHIISFDVPYPANYGGVVDVYHKIVALSKIGFEIYLHCFQYGREEAPELNKYCKEVWYYPRLPMQKIINRTVPWFVASRKNGELLQRLISIEAPILYEGVHTTFYSGHPALATRTQLLRAHNAEHEYYKQLSKRQTDIPKKIYLYSEARILKKYESSLKRLSAIFTISNADKPYFKNAYPKIPVLNVPPFHGFENEISATEKENYLLYHGNLKHPENVEAIKYILKKIAPKINQKIILAGRSPDEKLKKEIMKHKNVSLIEDPAEATLIRVLQHAHIHLLPTFQQSGMKLKLVAAIFAGGHVIANDPMLQGTALGEICVIANSADEFIHQINRLENTKMTEDNLARRKKILDQQLDNEKNALIIKTCLQGLSH